ncbi:response regulator [Actinospica sp. MGRD01-02]|uniref:histidine kinase n=1 Tax=Actinospica acidithermotolerans TaxID=2828514 RepID=A0A941E7X6_9ACTN|nr:hybrid sensor histidine kinase/response regulator [Actinospica acidithermotolerans]MBR7825593.1 response regulator [Actinospica acidithermotolerans]
MTGAVQLLATGISAEQDVFALRRDGRAVAEIVGLDPQDQIRLATALSEFGRDRIGCADATCRFSLRAEPAAILEVALRWSGGPAPAAETLLSMRRLVRELDQEIGCRRGRIILRYPVAVPLEDFAAAAERVTEALSMGVAASREEDLRAQTRDLIVALEEARAHGEELKLLNEELEQTNSGVMALYAELSSELEQTNIGVVALHAELEDKTRRLREASEAKTRFWANVSHELRGPLNSVIGLSRLLADAPPEELGEAQRQQVELIASSGATLRTLVDELLDVAKAEAGQLIPQPAPVDLGLLLAELEAVMRPAVPNPGVALVFPEPAGLPALVTDETMLTRILRNLVGNSLKFTESGHVRIEVAVSGSDRDRIEIGVEDTGIGIPEQEQARIFEEFYQVRGPHQRGKAGTGLGLPYARRLAELLGGSLTLESAPGRGTRMTVSLPAPAAGAAADTPATVPCLVCADDDPAFAAVFRPTLTRLAERVIELRDGADLLATVRREGADAVVVDLDMPIVDGYEAVRLLAESEDLAAVPVVVVTGFALADVDMARLGHARAVLAKESVDASRLARALGLAPLDEGAS